MSRAMEVAQEIGDASSEGWREELGLLRAGAGTSLNNLVKKAYAKGEYATALKYLEQLLTLYQKIGDWVGEGTTLNYFAATAYAEGEYATARNYLEQNLKLMRKIKARAEEAAISWNIGLIYKEQGDLTKAEQYISRAVQIAEEIGDSSSEGWRKDLEKLRVEIKNQ
ncbi:MAG: tetratricopeptide repeat protein [Candidatus Electrothrix sp. AX2]|nr:tetratricopeptide repeat protein [Candidatus Electrothrix gigas]